MALVVVPGAKPHYVLWCCRYIAQWARLDLVSLSVVVCRLVPSPHALDLLFWEKFGCFPRRSPIEPTDQILTILPLNIGFHDIDLAVTVANLLVRCC